MACGCKGAKSKNASNQSNGVFYFDANFGQSEVTIFENTSKEKVKYNVNGRIYIVSSSIKYIVSFSAEDSVLLNKIKRNGNNVLIETELTIDWGTLNVS